jgi:hypothetical protein
MMHELDSTTRYIQELEDNMGEKFIIKHLKVLLNCSDKKERTTYLEKFKMELFAFENNPKESENISYFDFLSWIESKMEGKSILEIVQKKAQKFPFLKSA